MIYSEVSGTISEILISRNQIVEKETDLLIIECMKMLIPVTTKNRGKIINIYVKENDVINEGDKLIDVNYDIWLWNKKNIFDEDYINFRKKFGKLVANPSASYRYSKNPEIYRASNVDEKGKITLIQ